MWKARYLISGTKYHITTAVNVYVILHTVQAITMISLFPRSSEVYLGHVHHREKERERKREAGRGADRLR